MTVARLEGAPIAQPDEFEPNSYAVVRVPLVSWEADAEAGARVHDERIELEDLVDPLDAIRSLGRVLFWPQLALEKLTTSFMEVIGAPEDWVNGETEVDVTVTGASAVALHFAGSSVIVRARDSVRIDQSGPLRSWNVPDAPVALSVYGFDVEVEAALLRPTT